MHLSSVLGRTELCHEVCTPGPQKTQIISNENHHLALLDLCATVALVFLRSFSCRVESSLIARQAKDKKVEGRCHPQDCQQTTIRDSETAKQRDRNCILEGGWGLEEDGKIPSAQLSLGKCCPITANFWWKIYTFHPNTNDGRRV